MVGFDGLDGNDSEGLLHGEVLVSGETVQPIGATGMRVGPRRAALLAGLITVAIVVAVVFTTVIALHRHGRSLKAVVATAPSVHASLPITDVDWHNATAAFAAPFNNGYCLSGSVTFRQGRATANGQTLEILDYRPPVYGDLTGDGRPEAVLEGRCTSGEGTGHPDLIIVTQATDGTLRQVDFIDPNEGMTGELSAARIESVQVTQGRLVVAMPAAPVQTMTRTYEWNGLAMHRIGG